MRIKDPYPPEVTPESRIRVQGDIAGTDYRYLFRQVLGVRGVQEPMIATFFKKLAEEMRKPEHEIQPFYDDDNDTKVQRILDRLNFNPVGAGEECAMCERRIIDLGPSGTVGATSSESEQEKLSDTLEKLVRRPDSGTDRRASPRNGGGGTEGVGDSSKDKTHQPADVQSNTGGGKRRVGKEKATKDSGKVKRTDG